MTILKLSDAKAHLGRYARQANQGESFIVAERNQMLARLVPLDEKPGGVGPKMGLMDGVMEVPDNFNAPLESFEADFYDR